jgi:hypothetical protein
MFVCLNGFAVSIESRIHSGFDSFSDMHNFEVQVRDLCKFSGFTYATCF